MPASEPSGCLTAIFRILGLGGGGALSGAAEPLPYGRKDWLFSRAERSFFGVLEQAVAGRYRIFAKVRLCDLLWLPKGCEERRAHQNRISSKHVDFVLCTLDDVRPVLVIELDDASHDREDRKERDAFVDRALATAGLPVLHVRARHAYNVAEIARVVRAAVDGGQR